MVDTTRLRVVPTTTANSNSRWQRCFAVTCLMTVITLLSLELVARFAAYLDPPLQSNNSIFEQKYRLVQNFVSDGKPIIFCMGDSMMNRAVYPDLLASLLKKNGLDVNVINLGVDGGTPAIAQRLLQVAIRRNLIPCLVLYDLKIECMVNAKPLDVFRIRNSLIAQKDSEITELRDFDNTYLGRSARKSNICSIEGLQEFLEVHSVLIRFRDHFKNRIKSFFAALTNFRLFEVSLLKGGQDFYPFTSKLGWTPNSAMLNSEKIISLEEKIQSGVATRVQSLKKEDSTVETWRYAGIQQICTSNNICYALVWLPHYAPFFDKNLFAPSLTNKIVETKIEEAAVPQDNLNTLVVDIGNDEPSYFTDPWHLDTYGAVKTTEALAQKLCNASFAKYLQRN